jgi:hypothetical protein
MMKTFHLFLPLILFCSGITPQVQGAATFPGSRLPLAYPETAQPREYPGYRMLAEMGWVYLPVKEPYPPLWHLQEMLKKNELELFYMCADPLFHIYCGIGIRDLRGEQFREMYHLFGLVTATPFYQVDFSGERRWEYGRRTADLLRKEVTLSCLSRIVGEEFARRLNVNRKEVGRFSALYAAVILKGFREEYQATSEEKLRKRWKEGAKNAWKVHREGRVFSWEDQFIVAQDRNRSMKRSIEEWLEEGLIRILVGYFPGRTAEARQYIRMAGYEDREINGLVDRTLGRAKETEFMYRGSMNKKR